MFRRLYWVTEYIAGDGRSKIAGVYTSVPDLIRRGLAREEAGILRVTLTKLDSDKDPFGSWCAPEFEGIEEALDQFVRTEEFTIDEVIHLATALRGK